MIALELGTLGWVLMGLIVWCVASVPVGVLVGMLMHDTDTDDTDTQETPDV